MFQTFDPQSDKSFANKHMPKLRAALAELKLDGLIVPHDDEYLNEYLPDNAERLMWVSGFSGSAGSAIVLKDKAAIFSDGRYTLQLREQVDQDFFELHNSEDTKPADWLGKNVTKEMVIGYDPMLISKGGLAPFLAKAAKHGFALAPVRPNPIDEAWEGRPEAPCTPVIPHPTEFAGLDSVTKRERIAAALKEAGADAVLLTAPHSLAWLFNIRGGDVHASPLPLGRAILNADGTGTLFLDPRKVDEDLKAHLGDDIYLDAEKGVDAALAKLGNAGKTVMLDPNLTPLYYMAVLEQAGAKIIEDADPCALPRAMKNPTELDGTRSAHIRDGAAVTRFLHWFAHEAPKETLTEISAAQKLEEFRRETNSLRDISFDTISGVGAHGAIPHYRVTTKSDTPIKKGDLFLIDSGGQYQDGTTDITRTMAVDTPSEDMRRAYTLVLKGHIALATIKFPAGISGHQLDAIARRPLWEAGLDYDHGTGHGVGSYLGVHEGPQNISKRPIHQALKPGMICSNEPGYYKAGEFGIRIENLIIVTQPEPVPGGEREMMGFETITLAPLDRSLIVKDMLTDDEITWVNAYHQKVWDAISPLIGDEERAWLKDQTAAL